MNRSSQPINVALPPRSETEAGRLIPCSPYYTGPSGPVSPVPWCYRPCAPGVPECWRRPDEETPDQPLPPPAPLSAVYGFFYQAGSLTLSSPGCIPFSGSGATIQNIEQSDGILTLPEAGIYDVSYTLHLPASASASGTAVILRNGAPIPGTSLDLSKSASAPLTLVSRSIQSVSARSTLCVSLSQALNISASSEDIVLSTLCVVRIA